MRAVNCIHMHMCKTYITEIVCQKTAAHLMKTSALIYVFIFNVNIINYKLLESEISLYDSSEVMQSQ